MLVVIEPRFHGNTNVHWVTCDDCQACGPVDLGWSGAEETWNTRPIEDKLGRELYEERQGTSMRDY